VKARLSWSPQKDSASMISNNSHCDIML
jgi:hypothetical protein